MSVSEERLRKIVQEEITSAFRAARLAADLGFLNLVSKDLVREVVREEVGVALTVAMHGDTDLINDYASGSLTGDQLAERLDLTLKSHQPAEHPRDTGLQLNESSCASGLSQAFSLHPINNGLSDGQVVGNVAEERNEIHASPSFDGLDNQSVGDRLGPVPPTGPGHPSGGGA